MSSPCFNCAATHFEAALLYHFDSTGTTAVVSRGIRARQWIKACSAGVKVGS